MRKMVFFLFLVFYFSASLQGSDFPTVEGWKPEGKIKVFHPGNLHDYINGAAENFLAYGFQELRVSDLSSDGLVMTVNIYDMGNEINAFGIYTTERPGDTERYDIGGEAVIMPPYQCLLLKSTYYVKVDAYEGEISVPLGKSLLKGLVDALPGDDGLPSILELLPKDEKVYGSEGFIKKSYQNKSDILNTFNYINFNLINRLYIWNIFQTNKPQ